MDDDFTEMTGRELRRRYDQFIDDYIKEIIIGEGTGEPVGILNTSGAWITAEPATNITWDDIVDIYRRMTPVTYRVEEAP